MKRLLSTLAFAPLTVCAELPASVQRILDGHGISADEVSIYIQATGADEPVLSHLPDVPRNPASVMKLVTTWSALELLGPAYSWPTEVYFKGKLDGEELDGDLALKGFGDPYLVVEEFWKLLRAIRSTGLAEIGGDLVLDDSYFQIDEADPGAFDGQPYRTYNVIPNALLVNFKAVHFRFYPRTDGRGVRIVSDPVLSNLEIENQLSLVARPCSGYQRGVSFNPTDPAVSDRIVFAGRFPTRCRVYGFSRTVMQHDTYLWGLFESLWREMGGEIKGALASGIVADDEDPMLVWRSPPLGEVIRSINKNSNNVMTRQLVYTLGAEQFGPPATRANGVEVIMQFLASKGWDVASLALENGAGLTRDGRISARLLAQTLLGAAASPYAAEFVASLSLAGLDGTTRGRFDRRSGSGQMHVKTGRLDHVSALAGYLHAGTTDYVVAIMMNSENAHRGPGQELEEAVMAWANSLPSSD